VSSAADRGGPFGRDTASALAQAEREGAAPGTEFRFASSAESSPIRGALRRRTLALLATGCLIVAVWHAAGAALVHGKALLGQRMLTSAWHETLTTRDDVKPWPWADTHPIARMTVPDHDVDLLVLAGASGRTLAWGPGHVGGSAQPGAQGTSVITAHRDTHFAFLAQLVPGDRIVVRTRAGETHVYRVERTLVAHHKALKLPAGDRASTLALVTCYPFDAIDPGTPLRYAVIAVGVRP
jgi:sortase A